MVMTTASLRRLQELAPDSKVDAQRFRPNIVIDLPGEADFVEAGWAGVDRSPAFRTDSAAESSSRTFTVGPLPATWMLPVPVMKPPEFPAL